MSKPTKPTTVCFYFEVTLAGDEAVNTFCQLEVLMCQWRHVVKLLDEDGPFIYSLTRTKRATSRRYPDACACQYAKNTRLVSVPGAGVLFAVERLGCGPPRVYIRVADLGQRQSSFRLASRIEGTSERVTAGQESYSGQGGIDPPTFRFSGRETSQDGSIAAALLDVFGRSVVAEVAAVSAAGNISLGDHIIGAGLPLAGHRVTVRPDGPVAHILTGGVLVRTLACPVPEQARSRLRGARAGTASPPQLPEPQQVLRRVSVRGTIMVGGQRIQVGLPQAGKTAQVTVEADTFAVHVAPDVTMIAARKATSEIRRHKASHYPPRTAPAGPE